jgi:hypothetical protein
LIFGASSIAAPQNTPSVIVVPAAKVGSPAEVIQKDLSQAALVKHYHFSIRAPKGWSLIAEGYSEPPSGISDHSDAMVTLTPSNDTVNDPTYVGLRTVYGSSLPPTLEGLYQVVSKDQTKKTRYVQLNGQRWIFSQYEGTNARGVVVQQYAVRTIVSTHEGPRGFLAVAATPKSDSKTFGPVLLSILNTVKVDGK